MRTTRRGFLGGCSAAIAAMSGARFNAAVFGNPNDEQHMLVVVFLRGGMDVLNFMPPIGGADRGFYEAARNSLQLSTQDALPLGTTAFGLHPGAAPLVDIFDQGDLALVRATGMHEDTRSHFDAMNYMELGTPGVKSGTTGWITRHLTTVPTPENIALSSWAAGHYVTTAARGSEETVSINNARNFTLLDSGPWQWRGAQRTALRQMYSAGDSPLHRSGVRTLNAADVIEAYPAESYTPAGGVIYPGSELGAHLRSIAQMVKLQLGLRVATVDVGGWDTHESQGAGSGGIFGELIGRLSQGLAAFYEDLEASGFADKATVVVMSEFGRRVQENGDGGTDHGHGGLMMLLGGQVNGGLHGDWPGLDPQNLFEGIDLAVTTDYRQVLSEILIKQLGNPHIETVFPGYTGYTPLNVIQGTDLPLRPAPIFGQDSPYIPVSRDPNTIEETTDGLPVAITLNNMQATPSTTRNLINVGLAATAGLVALRSRD